MTKKVAVVGGGIVGMAAALFLQKEYDVTLFEREIEPKPIGAGIMLQPSGLAVLEKLGVVKSIISRGRRIEGFYGVNHDQKVDFDIDFRDFDVYGYGVQRGSVYFELYEKVVKSDIILKLGAEVIDISKESPNRIETSVGDFYDGFEFVIVANGARSLLRSKFDNILDFEGASGQAALWVKVKGSGKELSNRIHQFYFGTKFMVGLMPIGQEISDDEPFMFNFFSGISQSYAENWTNITLDQWKQDMNKVSNDIGFYLDQVKSKDDLMLAPYHDVQLKKYSHGNVLFIGDAAHAMGPHLSSGTNLGLLDAFALSETLKTASSTKEAFNLYEKDRKKQLSYYQLISRLITPYFQSDVDKSFFRRNILSVATKIPILNKIIIETITGKRIDLLNRIKKSMYFNDAKG